MRDESVEVEMRRIDDEGDWNGMKTSTYVNFDISVDLPTLGNPTNPTLAIPVLATSNPSPGPPPPPPGGLMSSRRSLASLAIMSVEVRWSCCWLTLQLTEMVFGIFILLGL
jgi:hypothetical protein